MRLHYTICLVLLFAACSAQEKTPAPVADTSCFGSRVLSFQDLVAEVVIPTGEDCASGSFSVVFTRGGDTLAALSETRVGSVGFIGTADVDADGRGEFFVSTSGTGGTGGDARGARGALYAYTESAAGITRLALAPLDSMQLAGYAGQDRFGFGGADQLVRAFPRAGADTAWFGYSHGEGRWNAIARPVWVR